MSTPYQNSVTPAAHTPTAAPAAGRPWAGLIVAMAWLGLLVMGSAQAIDIPALPVVQPNIAAVNPTLVQQREKLLMERKALLDRANSHNQVCSAVEAGSAADASCTKAYPSLEAAINSHVQASKQYNDNYLAAVNRAASQKPAPSGDPMVVDTRVPSGLPKAVDDAIAGVYASAPPGVGQRVSRGFQAVMAKDWNLAKVWFLDALKLDPDNANLKQLVATIDSSQQANTIHAGVVDDRNEPAGLGGKSNFKGAIATPGQAKPAPGSTTGPQTQQPGTRDDLVFDLLVRQAELARQLEQQRAK